MYLTLSQIWIMLFIIVAPIPWEWTRLEVQDAFWEASYWTFVAWVGLKVGILKTYRE